ncbi:MAG: aminomethyl transferase family protein, partial [Rhizobiales bacterium]|nr:aminomethyl transferase family protein [Hyphomicrobiales bacterium]
NRISASIGGTCLTLMLNRRGTIEGEATIARLADDQFYLVTGAPSERRVWDWLTLHCGVPMDGLELINQTDNVGILTLAGPRARDVLAACSDDDVSNAAFGWLKARQVTVAGIACCALRLSFTGELAYELHVPNNRLGQLWDALWSAGQAHGIGAFGSKALDSLRLEKFYRGGHELSNDASHKDVDQLRFAKVDKDFVGKDAMLAREPRSKIALLALDGETTDCLIGEAVLMGDEPVGSVTSAAYGHTVGKSLAIAFLPDQARVPGTRLEISLFGERVSAVVLEDAPHDPGNVRLKV